MHSDEIIKIARQLEQSISKDDNKGIFRVEIRDKWVKKMLPFLTQKNKYPFSTKPKGHGLIQLTVYDIPKKIRDIMIKKLHELKKKFNIPLTLVMANDNIQN